MPISDSYKNFIGEEVLWCYDETASGHEWRGTHGYGLQTHQVCSQRISSPRTCHTCWCP